MGRNLSNRYAFYVTWLLTALLTITVACIATGQNGPDPHQKLGKDDKKMTGLTRQELTQRATTLGNPVLATLEKPETVVEQVPTGFLSNGGIYRVSTRPPDRPRVYNLGVWGTDGIEVLNGKPELYFQLAANSGLRLSSGADYVTYVTTFIDVTRDFTGGVQLLNNIDESWWLPSPSPDEVRHREEILAKYAKVVEAPKVSGDSNTSVIVYLIRDRALIRMNAKVEGDGRIQITEDVLEPQMPTVMLN